MYLIPILCILATAKIMLQSDFSKNGNTDIKSNIFYNGIMFTTAALLFLPFLIKGEVSLQTVIFGMIMGILSVAFQIFYICAFSSGKMSLTVIINNFGMILPMAVSFIMFDEDFGILNLLGTILALVSFVLTTSSKGRNNSVSENKKFKWLIFTALVFFTNGMISINQKFYSVYADDFNVFEFVGAAYVTAALLSAIIFFFIKTRKTTPFKCYRRYVITFCISGCLLGLFQCVNTYAASVIDGTILYSTYNCGVSLLSVLIGRTIFKEFMSKRQCVGLVPGIAAIALLCL